MSKIANDISVEDASIEQLLKALKDESNRKAALPKEDTVLLDIKSLPKIETTLFNTPKSAPPDVVRVNDPITHLQKPVIDKDADAGSRWFNMKKPEMTAELKRDLLVLKNRSALDRKRHYKKEKWEVPKFFQTGTIVEGNTEFYSARMSKKNRGRTLAEEILNDSDSGEYFKKKYAEIQKKKTSGGKKHYKKIKLKRQGF